MSQKCYKENIIEILLKGENHVRGISKALNINQMSISRRLKELYSENIVDFRLSGKNKVFFLKKNFESMQHIYITELHKTINIIKKYPGLRIIFEKIRKNKKIKLAILFGSYARKAAGKESDIDIYIESTDKKIKSEIADINTKLNVKIGGYDKENLLIKEILKNHIIIKGVEEYYEKNKFFE